MFFSNVNSEKYDSGVPEPRPADKLQALASSPPTPRQQFDVIGDKGFFQILTAFKISEDVGHNAACVIIAAQLE